MLNMANTDAHAQQNGIYGKKRGVRAYLLIRYSLSSFFHQLLHIFNTHLIVQLLQYCIALLQPEKNILFDQ